MNREFWRNRRVFLTGHTGFKGSWLALWLTDMGAQVTGFALNPPTEPNLHQLFAMNGRLTAITNDITNGIALRDALRLSKPEIVIHMAAQPIVLASYREPVKTYETNVMGTVHLLEAIRTESSVRAVVNVTTDKCYENKEWVWGYRENESLCGEDPYSNSKSCSELVTACYRKSFFRPANYELHRVALATARSGNVIGGGDWAADRLVPDCLRALLKGEIIKLRNPQAIRPWQHVLEPLRGYLTLAEKLFVEGSRYGEGWNFGPNASDARSVEWVARKLCELWAKEAVIEFADIDQPHEAQILRLDCSKAGSSLGWLPVWSIEEALRFTVEWYKAFDSGQDMTIFSLAQIHHYEAMVRVKDEK